MKTYRLPIVLGLLSCLVVSGCRSGYTQQSDSGEYLGIASEQFVTLSGRPFRVTSIDKMVPSPFLPDSLVRFQVLTISGDRRLLSFDSSTGPYDTTIRRDTVRYGGHDFVVTAVPGIYIMDADTLSLAEGLNIVHVFQDGRYVGARAL